MKILTPRNNKDYYDYLTGIYGVDDKIVYDRRQFTVLSRLDSPLFSYIRTDKDAPKTETWEYEWQGRRCRRVAKLVGTTYHCMLEVGLKWYFFEVERYLDCSTNVCIDWKIVKTKEISKDQRVGVVPMSFMKAFAAYGWLRGLRDIRVQKTDAIPNPILTGTPIPALIPPQELYDNLNSYISSLNDIEIIDTRTDVQKAESAGFDRKTSFRNIK